MATKEPPEVRVNIEDLEKLDFGKLFTSIISEADLDSPTFHDFARSLGGMGRRTAGHGSYRDVQNPSQVRRQRLDNIKGILSSGAKTIRRIFYMLGSGASYNSIIKDCVWLRLQGELDWSSIVEEGRHLLGTQSFENLAEFLGNVPGTYKLSKKEAFTQPIEVWLEKATLQQTFYQVTDKYDIGLLVTRGEISWTALYNASLRLGGDELILYFGDNDSYGHNIYNGIQEHLGQLGCTPSFQRIAMTDEQEAKYCPGERHLDGMPVDELKQVLEATIRQYLDADKFNRLCEKEAEDAAKLEKILESRDREDDD
jgi:hypothetical protein